MKLTQHNPGGLNLIRRYDAVSITVGERELRASCLVTPEALIAAWPPRDVQSLTNEHLDAVFALSPQIVVLATGVRQQFPAAQWRAQFATRGVGLEVMEIGAACRTYNVLVSEERKVLAAILLPG
jgi:uncharacterized protein